MSERTRSLVMAAAMAAMTAVLALLVFTSPSEVDRVQSIGQRIKCPVCQGESIADSPSAMARDMMSLVAERVSEGADDAQIIEDLLSAYSGAVLLDPPASGSTLFLWLAPAAAILVGAGVILWWRRHPTRPVTSPEDGPGARRLAPLLLLGGALAVIVVVAGAFLQERSGATSGVAELAGQDLDDVSNETMEAVVAANADHPQVDGMRLALAERYYEAGEYSAAFPHYLEVAESGNASDGQAVAALIRLGWMAWLSDAQPTDAIQLFDQALAIDGSSSTARYLKGQVLWCGAGDLDAAEALFEEVLDDPDLVGDSRARVESDLDAVRNGGVCA